MRGLRLRIVMMLGRWLGVPVQVHQTFFAKGNRLRKALDQADNNDARDSKGRYVGNR